MLLNMNIYELLTPGKLVLLNMNIYELLKHISTLHE